MKGQEGMEKEEYVLCNFDSATLPPDLGSSSSFSMPSWRFRRSSIAMVLHESNHLYGPTVHVLILY
ncbi:hypothetical protein E2C01_016333 [Portunus trituberculatus]|uniref:Uncharacterized protein n=1 Tax=Portunus trituberculatus TaxID=210409 RepID=A0A5B7DNT1_PORTR|nr:hypothetical protein [Portunus trituberculatus]